jgi:fatty acid desaturase
LEKRRAIDELHTLRPARNLVAFGFLSLWAVSAAFGHRFPTWPARLIEYLTIGVAMHGLAVLMHEASHGNLVRRPTLDRWLGFLCGVPVLLACSAYRVVHLRHHRYLRGPRDPEEFIHLAKHRWIQSGAFYIWGIIGGASYLVFVPLVGLARGTRRDRVKILQEYTLLFLLYAALFGAAAHYSVLPEVFHSVVLPWAVVILFTNIRGWSEHPMTIAGSPWTATRTITSLRLVSLLMCNVNYHLEHHLYSSIPWYNLPKLNALLRHEYRAAGSFVDTSYSAFLWNAARTGVHGLVPPLRERARSEK